MTTYTRRPIMKAQLGLRLPGRVREGSQAYFRKSATLSARADMADIVKKYEMLIRHLGNVTPDILENALIPVFDKSQEYVPVKTGLLKESGVLEVSDEGGQPQAEIIYGNAEAWYAALVHEYVWLNHEPPTRAKYLQSAMEEELDSVMSSLLVDYTTALGM
jgi:hypothetical protein